MKSKKLVYGVGINDADYVTQVNEIIDGKQKLVWVCPFYRRWQDMLKRCYSEREHLRNPTYKGCSVCDEWLTFSNFRSWMLAQEWENCQLDKDLLFEGNTVYSPETCIFVHRKVNMFTIDSGAARGDYMIGVSWKKSNSKFVSNCNNPFTGKKEHLGYFTNELDAHLAWKKRKHELACQLAESELVSDSRLAEALKTRYVANTADRLNDLKGNVI